jgi:gliding motility-associated protein GldM
MAGGKETPRQKLIGLMYLVLLALLALQVSSSIIDKFLVLNESLQMSYNDAFEVNKTKIASIEKAVSESGAKYKPILDEANDIRNKTKAIIDRIDKVKLELINRTGGTEDGKQVASVSELRGVKLKGSKDEDITANYMVGPEGSKKGEAYALKKEVDEYIEMVNKTIAKYKKDAKPYPSLFLDADKDPIFQGNADQKGKDFAELNFAHTPMVSALATLSDKQLRVAQMEADVLGLLATQVGAVDIKVEGFEPLVLAESQYVPAGMPFKAKVILAPKLVAGSNVSPKWSAQGLKKSDGTTAEVEFKAAATTYDESGQYKTKFSGSVSYTKPDGTSDSKPFSMEYFVVKPVIQVQSAGLSSLYLNCCNKLSIQCPALGVNYKPDFAVTGGDFTKGAKVGEITVMPKSIGKKTVKITVSNEGAALETIEFDVKPIPLPRLEILANGKPIDKKDGILAAAFPSVMNILPKPDATFGEQNKEDAKYSIADGEIILARGTTPVRRVPVSQTVDLLQFKAVARPGDRFVIKVDKVERSTCSGSKEKVEGANDVINIPVN